MGNKRGYLNLVLSVITVILIIWLIVLLVPKVEKGEAEVETGIGALTGSGDAELQSPAEIEETWITDLYLERLEQAARQNQEEISLEIFLKNEEEEIADDDYLIYCAKIKGLTKAQGLALNITYPQVYTMFYDFDNDEVYEFVESYDSFYSLEKGEQEVEICDSIRFGLLRDSTTIIMAVNDAPTGKQESGEFWVAIE